MESSLQITLEASQHQNLLKRQAAARIKQWLDKLSEPVSHPPLTKGMQRTPNTPAKYDSHFRMAMFW